MDVLIRPLEWREIDELANLKNWRADCYIIRKFYEDQFVVSGWASGTNPYKTLDAAKAAAQADYEQRIRSAIVSHPLPQGEAPAWTDEQAFDLARRMCVAHGGDPDAPIYQGHGQVGENWQVYLPMATEALIALWPAPQKVAEMERMRDEQAEIATLQQERAHAAETQMRAKREALIDSRDQLTAIIDDGLQTDFRAWRDSIDAALAPVTTPPAETGG